MALRAHGLENDAFAKARQLSHRARESFMNMIWVRRVDLIPAGVLASISAVIDASRARAARSGAI